VFVGARLNSVLEVYFSEFVAKQVVFSIKIAVASYTSIIVISYCVKDLFGLLILQSC